MDQRAYRAALGNFPTGVAIVTTLDKIGRPVGMTVNSFTSISLTPRLILWSIANSAFGHRAFTEARHFGISVLSDSQILLATRFAVAGEDKFAGTEIVPGIGGVPLIAGSISQFHCRRVDVILAGDHSLILGEVVDYSCCEGDPLIFCRAAYLGRRARSDLYGSEVAGEADRQSAWSDVGEVARRADVPAKGVEQVACLHT